jgi:hypothetical protein
MQDAPLPIRLSKHAQLPPSAFTMASQVGVLHSSGALECLEAKSQTGSTSPKRSITWSAYRTRYAGLSPVGSGMESAAVPGGHLFNHRLCAKPDHRSNAQCISKSIPGFSERLACSTARVYAHSLHSTAAFGIQELAS